MPSYSFVFIVLLLLMISVDSRKHFQERRLRYLWERLKEKLKEKLVDRLHIDIRHFDKEYMLLFPDVAYQSSDNDGKWHIMLHGWRYEKNRRKDWFGFSASRWLGRIAINLVKPDDILYLNGSINHDRLKPFFVEDQTHEKIIITIGDSTHTLRTDKHGEFYERFDVASSQIETLKQSLPDGNVITYEALGDNQDKSTGIVRLIEPRQGISVISDIDDTIKISEVLDKVRLLANTFIHPFKVVPGMAELYQEWRVKNNNCTFHYLSGMPDQLYILTQEFINGNKFPDGSFHMRHFGWAISSLFNFLHSESTFIHKISYLRFFLSNTIRDYVLVGDSGEKDPEVYGTITREYPARVRAIFIRAIKGEAFDDQRFVSAFQGVPQEKWQIFNDPQQLPRDLSRAPKAVAG